MANKTTHLMLDDVDVSIEASRAAQASAIAGYVNGRYKNWPQIVKKWGHTKKYLLSIDVVGDPKLGAQALDIERYDATIAEAPAWWKATHEAGAKADDLRYFPKLYTSASNVAALVHTMEKHGIKRNQYMVWSAHYTGKPHICAPHVCGYPQADATQWTDKFDGLSLDATLFYGYFFAMGPDPKPAPAPDPKPVEHAPPPVVKPPAPEPPPAPAPEPKPAPKPTRYERRAVGAQPLTLTVPAGTVMFIPVEDK